MGFYIEKNSKGYELSQHSKAQDLINDGATVTDASFKENLVCVVDCGTHTAAAYIHSQFEFEFVSSPGDKREKTWLIYEHAKELSGYSKTQ